MPNLDKCPACGVQFVAVPKGCIVHKFALRRGVVIDVPLPSDLTREDVARIKRALDAVALPDEDEGAAPAPRGRDDG